MPSILLHGFEGDPGLSLVVSGPLGVVLEGHGVQGLQDHLTEPLPYGDLHGVVGGVVGTEGEGPFESRIDLAESTYELISTDPRGDVLVLADSIRAASDFCHLGASSEEQYIAEAKGFFKGSESNP